MFRSTRPSLRLVVAVLASCALLVTACDPEPPPSASPPTTVAPTPPIEGDKPGAPTPPEVPTTIKPDAPTTAPPTTEPPTTTTPPTTTPPTTVPPTTPPTPPPTTAPPTSPPPTPPPTGAADPHPLYPALDRGWLRSELVAGDGAATTAGANALLAVPPAQPNPTRSVSCATKACVEDNFRQGNATITVTADLIGQGGLMFYQGRNNVVIFEPGTGANYVTFSHTIYGSDAGLVKIVGGYFPGGIGHNLWAVPVNDVTIVGSVLGGIGGQAETHRWACVACVISGTPNGTLIGSSAVSSDFAFLNTNIAGQSGHHNGWGHRQGDLDRVLWADVWVYANSHKPWRANGGQGTVATSSQGAINTARETIFGNDTLADGPYDVGPDTGRPRDNTNFLNLRILIGGTDHFQVGGRNELSRRWRITRGIKWITVGPRTPAQMNRQLDDFASWAPAGTSWDYGTGTTRNITVGTAMPPPPAISHADLAAAGYAGGQPAYRRNGTVTSVSDPRTIQW